MPDPSLLQVNLGGIPLRNPVVLAAGTAGTLHEMAEVIDLSRIGALVSKSITPEPREGNQTWRILPHPSGVGMLNAIGLANPGVDAFCQTYIPKASSLACPVLASVAGFSIEDYTSVAASLCEAVSPIAGIELNLSCPNVKHGTEFGAAPHSAAEVVRAVRAAGAGASTIPLFVKLSPVAPAIASIARAAIEAGATGLTIGNTLPAMAIDVDTRRPLLANTTGGLSGPAIHAAAVKSVWDVFNGFGRDLHGPGKHLPIVGLGGVTGWQDAAEFILAGATAVAMGTVLFADPRAPITIARGLEKWVTRQGVRNVGELVGAVKVGN